MQLQLERMRACDLAAVIALWDAAKRDVYTFIELERGLSREDNDAFFRAHILPPCEITVALDGHELVGFLAMQGSYVDRLYVAPHRQRSGVGGALLAHARRFWPEGLALHTHQKNRRACAFYEKHGFRAVRCGLSPPPECEPDVEYHWRPGAPAQEGARGGR